jgi:surfactin synthase thioesterase subunit
LLTLPFGGGNESSYARLREMLNPRIDMMSFEIAGHGKRMREPLAKNLHVIVEDILHQFRPKIKGPFAIFGHSMGAYLGHLLTHRLMDENLPLPKHLLLSSKIAPSMHKSRKRSLYTDEEFVVHLKDLKGMPDAILNDAEMLSIFLPIIRADFEALDNYRYQRRAPYPVPLTVMAGTRENVPEENIQKWAAETNSSFRNERFEGDHFWIFDKARGLCDLINETLGNYLSK